MKEGVNVEKISLFHGTFEKNVVPTYGVGEEKHDYGKGFYLTENIELAKEWAVCRPDVTSGWVHQYELDISELKILQSNILHSLSIVFTSTF